MIRLDQIKLRAGEPDEALRAKIEKRLGMPSGSLGSFRVLSESVDARKKPEIYRVFNVAVPEGGDAPEKTYEDFLPRRAAAGSFDERPVIAGFGPCGMFAALRLAQAGACPIVAERGASMDERVKAVEAFWGGGALDVMANAQFGEGGAGTFSDGKLTTGTKSPWSEYILRSFVRAGADPDILYRQRAHIGTDVLRRAVVNIRNEIIRLGGEIRFRTQLTSVDVQGGKLRGVWLNGSEYVKTGALIFAPGHSSRDSLRYFADLGLMMEQKPFSMGVRIEHLQRDIDAAQYGAPHGELGLWPAEYKLSVKLGSGRGVYTFCMCPGGFVVASASEPGLLVTNGMSLRARDGENANSAVLVDVRPEDLPSSDPLAGLAMQERYEGLAFELGGCDNFAPAQRVGDFLGTASRADALRCGSDDPEPSYRPGVCSADISACLPPFVSGSLREALPLLGRKLRGFDAPGALLTAIESRSSSPVRIKRAASLEALAADGSVIEGLYPGGEGAGYAGGIMSAAQDGVRLAEQILSLHL
ncbi:MAG: hypothetical protein IKR08_01940 [Firmicutes bacterium]|nr:hypothetical protein [Bacillota bacterium]